MDPDANVFDIAPDGRHIVFVFDPSPQKRLDNCKALAEINVASGRSSTIAIDPAWDFEAPRYSPDGRRIAFLASNIGRRHTAPANAGADRARAAAGACSPARGTTRSTRRCAGRPTAPRSGSPPRSAPAAISGASRSRAAARRSSPRRAAGCTGSTSPATPSSPSPTRCATRRGCTCAGTAAGGADRALQRRAARDPRAWPRSRSAVVTGANDEPVQMWLVYPPGFDARRRRSTRCCTASTAVRTRAAGDTFHYRWNNQLFAAQGYVVACVNYHGSSGFGNAFLDSITHRWGELELKDVEAATDWLKQATVGRQRPHLRQRRQLRRLHGRLDERPREGRPLPGLRLPRRLLRLAAMYADDAYTWHSRELGANYWDEPAKIQSQSPTPSPPAFRDADARDPRRARLPRPRPAGPGLLQHPQGARHRARLVWFPDENHWILKPRNSRLWYGEFFAWLKAHDPGAKAAATAGKGKRVAAEPQPRRSESASAWRRQRKRVHRMKARRLAALALAIPGLAAPARGRAPSCAC